MTFAGVQWGCTYSELSCLWEDRMPADHHFKGVDMCKYFQLNSSTAVRGAHSGGVL